MPNRNIAHPNNGTGGGPHMKPDIDPDNIAGTNASSVGQPLNILGVFDGMAFPASKMELIAYAQDAGATEEVMDHLQSMPDDIYNSFADLGRHINDMEIVEEEPENLWGSAEPHEEMSDDAERFLDDLNGKDPI